MEIKQLIPVMVEMVERKEPFALATVVARIGSAPRSSGARMLVRHDGSTLGTVGGGILEAQVEKLAAAVLVSHQAVVQGFAFSGKDAATMDAICGGEVEVSVEWMDVNNPQLARILQATQAALQNRRRAWLATVLPPQGGDVPPQGGDVPPRGGDIPPQGGGAGSHCLVYADGSCLGSLPANLLPETVAEIRQPTLLESAGQRVMVEPLNNAGTVYIFGAGHVSRSLAEFTKAVGFWTVVLDDRPEYVHLARFPGADELVVLDSFAGALGSIPVDRESFLVIVTRGHLHDRTVLAQALKTNAGYIGMIGSRRKCELVYQELLKEGFTSEDLRRVHAPIGLPIQAETPEEIGVSIVAEMIQVRAGLLRST